MAKLTPALESSGWQQSADGKSIEKIFKFGNFRDAFAWMTRAAFEAEDMDHHPEWRNVYNRVEVCLTTHDTGGLTSKDLDLAARMDKLSD